MMEVRKFRQLTSEEQFILWMLIHFSDKNVSFALIGDRTAITLSNVRPSDSDRILREKTKAAVIETLNAEELPVDEGIFPNNLGFMTVGRAAIITNKTLSGEEVEEGKLRGYRRFALKFNLRRQLDMFEVIAIAFAEREDKRAEEELDAPADEKKNTEVLS